MFLLQVVSEAHNQSLSRLNRTSSNKYHLFNASSSSHTDYTKSPQFKRNCIVIVIDICDNEKLIISVVQSGNYFFYCEYNLYAF